MLGSAGRAPELMTIRSAECSVFVLASSMETWFLFTKLAEPGRK